MVSINLSWDVIGTGQGKGGRNPAAFGSCGPDKPGEPEAGLQKVVQTRKGTWPLYCWQERNRMVVVLFPL